jgi:hypothetical protein
MGNRFNVYVKLMAIFSAHASSCVAADRVPLWVASTTSTPAAPSALTARCTVVRQAAFWRLTMPARTSAGLHRQLWSAARQVYLQLRTHGLAALTRDARCRAERATPPDGGGNIFYFNTARSLVIPFRALERASNNPSLKTTAIVRAATQAVTVARSAVRFCRASRNDSRCSLASRPVSLVRLVTTSSRFWSRGGPALEKNTTRSPSDQRS